MPTRRELVVVLGLALAWPGCACRHEGDTGVRDATAGRTERRYIPEPRMGHSS